MKSFLSTCILIILIFFNSVGFAQNFQIKSKSESIEIQDDSSFVNEITILFKKSNETRLYPIFYDTELEHISDVQLFEIKGRREKKLIVKNRNDENVKLDYIHSKKIKVVEIPPNLDVKLTYIISCRELMYFSSLQFFSYNEIDTLKYQIKVPKRFKFSHNTIYQDSLPYFTIDSTITETNSVWNIKALPKKVEPDPLQFFGIYKNMKVPLMRTLVVPNAYNGQPINYMNNWYLGNIAPKQGLNNEVRQKIDELTANITEPLQIATILYNYVKTNFKYVAIEIGMGAFIPSHVNEVFRNKQGDCKDLSNFLSEALKYKGINSDIALAATFDHISDCDFPSLSSANHVICIVYINGETILLDPTDPIHKVGTPVESLQDRTILIVNSKGGSFYKAAGFSPQQNEILYELNLKTDPIDKVIKGTFEIDYKGISGNYLRRIRKNEGSEKFADFAKTFYDEIFGNQQISELTIDSESNKFHLQGNLAVSGKTYDDSAHTYLFIDFLPRLIESEKRETLIEGTYLNNPYKKKVLVKIKLDQPIEPFIPIEHNFSGDGISLNVYLTAKSEMEIECKYDFIFDHIFIEKDNIEKINQILESFKTIIDAPIVLTKEKS